MKPHILKNQGANLNGRVFPCENSNASWGKHRFSGEKLATIG